MNEINLRFVPAIPEGWQIWCEQIEVAGLNHRIDEAIAVAQGENQSLTLDPEPTNLHDTKAIKVLGWAQSSGAFRQFFLG
jgi:hypothetical protein